MSKLTLGADLSLTHSGIVILEGSKVIHHSVIKSKPPTDLTPTKELARIRKIVEDIEYIVINYEIDLAVIENFAFMARGTSLTQLAALSFFTRALLVDRSIPFLLCAPTSLKKFITGSGKGDKDMILMSIYKNYGFEAFDNNAADAYGLAAAGQAVLKNPINKLTIPQVEVIKLLQKQI